MYFLYKLGILFQSSMEANEEMEGGGEDNVLVSLTIYV